MRYMRWKKFPNFVIACILTIMFVIVTLLNLIGPLHVNSTGNINPIGPLFYSSILYLLFVLGIVWGIYFFMQKKPEAQFFLLIVVGIFFILIENFLWAWMGS